MKLRIASYLLLTLSVLIGSAWWTTRSQVNLQERDIARIPEGDSKTRYTAQFLINRFGFTQEGTQTGRSIFHHNFADDKNGGCNGLPCSLRDRKATRAWPQSKFEASSCETCHSTPRGSAGFGPNEQNIFIGGNRVRSNDMFGGGLIQQLGVEATEDLKTAREQGRALVTANGVNYSTGIGVRDGGSVNRDLIVRPFGRKGTHSHLRAFVSHAAFDHLGIQSQDRFQCPDKQKNDDGRCNGPIAVGLDPDHDGQQQWHVVNGPQLAEHERPEHPGLAVGEVDDPRPAVDDDQPHRQQPVDQPDEESVDDDGAHENVVRAGPCDFHV